MTMIVSSRPSMVGGQAGAVSRRVLLPHVARQVHALSAAPAQAPLLLMVVRTARVLLRITRQHVAPGGAPTMLQDPTLCRLARPCMCVQMTSLRLPNRQPAPIVSAKHTRPLVVRTSTHQRLLLVRLTACAPLSPHNVVSACMKLRPQVRHPTAFAPLAHTANSKAHKATKSALPGAHARRARVCPRPAPLPRTASALRVSLMLRSQTTSAAPRASLCARHAARVSS